MAEERIKAALQDLDITLPFNSVSEEAIAQKREELENRLVNPIYLAGTADTQEEYEKHYDAVFAELDRLNQELEGQEYLLGDQLTEADVRLYSILVRFDIIYYFAFRLNRSQVKDFPNLWRYAKGLYAQPEFRKAADFQKLKEDYYGNQTDLENPYHIIANGPDMSLWDTEE